MKAPTWEVSAGALLAFVNGATAMLMADLYTLTTAGGTVYRFTDCDRLLSVAGNTYQIGPKIERSDTRTVVGVEVSTMSVDMHAEPAVLMGSGPLVQALNRGVMDGGRVRVERLFCDVGWVQKGTLLLFQGRVATITTYGNNVTIEAESDTALLNVMIPSGVYQPSCRNTLYDLNCAVSRAAKTTAATATSASDATRHSFTATLGLVSDGFFSLGTITFTSGANAGISRSIKQHSVSGTVSTMKSINAWPYAVGIGDAFTCVPGCDKTVPACQTKFVNFQRFAGEPWIPLPDVVI